MNFKTHRFGQPLQRVEGMVERLSTEQRRQVDALDTRSQGTSPPPLQPRQPGGLLGAMKTHDDFVAPLGKLASRPGWCTADSNQALHLFGI